MGDLSRNFSKSEFRCPCCGRCEVHQELIDRLQVVRDILGRPLVITSGYRCEKYNLELARKYHSVAGSAHTKGWAADVKCERSWERFELISTLLAVGFNRIGIGKGFIHCDLDPGKPENVIWVYP